jgi:Flp pilus assembly protein TadG
MIMDMMNIAKRGGRRKGVAAVEFAILLIPLVIMVFGMTELGRAFYYYNGLLNSTRDASRYLSTQGRGEGEAEARCLAVHGNVNCTGDALVPGLATGMVQIAYETGVETGHGSVDLVRVTVDGFPFLAVVPFVVSNMVFGPIASTMRQGTS